MPRLSSTRRLRLQLETLEYRRLLAADFQVDAATFINSAYDHNDKVAEIGMVRVERDAADGWSPRPMAIDSESRDAGFADIHGHGHLDFARRSHRMDQTADLDRPLHPTDAMESESHLRLLHLPLLPAVGSISIYISQQRPSGDLLLSRVAIRTVPAIVHDVSFVPYAAQQPPDNNFNPPEIRQHLDSTARAEGESPVDDWQLPPKYITDDPGRISPSRGEMLPSDLSLFEVSARADVDSVSPSVLGASNVAGLQLQSGFIELSNRSANQVPSTTAAEEPSHNQVFVLNEPLFDLSSFNYAPEDNWTDIESADLIDLLELLGDGSDAEGDEEMDEPVADDTTPSDFSGDELAAAAEADSGDATDVGEKADAGEESHADTTERVFATWSDERQGMIELSRPQALTSGDVYQPLADRADDPTALQDLTLELDAVIGSARRFEMGDAQREMESNESDSTERVESTQADPEAHDEPLATRAVCLPLIVAMVRPRVREGKDRRRDLPSSVVKMRYAHRINLP